MSNVCVCVSSLGGMIFVMHIYTLQTHIKLHKTSHIAKPNCKIQYSKCTSYSHKHSADKNGKQNTGSKRVGKHIERDRVRGTHREREQEVEDEEKST